MTVTPAQVHALSLGWNRVLVSDGTRERVTTDGEFRRSLAGEGWQVLLTRAQVATWRARLKKAGQSTTAAALAAAINAAPEEEA